MSNYGGYEDYGYSSIALMHQECPKCGSSDALTIYEKDVGNITIYDGTCFSCSNWFSNNSLLKTKYGSELGIQEYKNKQVKSKHKVNNGGIMEDKALPKKKLKEFISQEKWKELKENPAMIKNHEPFRGISSKTSTSAGVLTEFQGIEPIKRYYPISLGGTISGVKVKILEPKGFYTYDGETGWMCDFFNYMPYHLTPSKVTDTVLLVAGEEDCLSAIEIFNQYKTRDGNQIKKLPVILSPTTGENCVNQVRYHYEFLCKFDRIIICFDMDDVGRKRAKDIAEILPAGKAFIMSLDEKDTNDMLTKGKITEYVSAYFNPERFEIEGVIGSSSLDSLVIESLNQVKIPLPPFLKTLENLMAGGIPLGQIINIIAETGVGKCLGINTPILMYDGSIKAVQDVVVGDLLMGDDDTPRTVLSLARGREDLYKVYQSGLEGSLDYVVNKSHILTLVDYDSYPFTIITGEPFIDINVEDYIKQMDEKPLSGIRIEIDEDDRGNPYRYASGYITKIEPLGEGDYYGFQIDGNKRFCLGDGTVTHNTTIVNEILYYWLFNSPHKVGVLSLELSAGQYGTAMLSRHIGRKLDLFKTPAEALAFINQPEIVVKRDELWKDENGHDRWYILDERDGDLEKLKNQVRRLVKSCGCKVIVIDPLQDVLDGLTNEEQSVFMRWQKQMIKEGITIINISHVRKSGSTTTDKDGNVKQRELREDDAQGSSSIVKSGGSNITISRDKTAEDEIEKNTIKVNMLKCRWTGNTGLAGYMFYDKTTHTLYDKEEFFKDADAVKAYEQRRDNITFSGNLKSLTKTQPSDNINSQEKEIEMGILDESVPEMPEYLKESIPLPTDYGVKLAGVESDFDPFAED